MQRQGRRAVRGRLAAVSFDLLDTLVRVDAARLPSVALAGRRIASTAPLLLDAARELAPRLPPERLLAELLRAGSELERDRRATLVEVPASRAFERAIRRLGIAPAGGEHALAERFANIHMRAVARASSPVEGAAAVAGALARRGLALAIVSNLDHAPAAAWLLDAARLTGAFDVVVVSAEVGVRKPHARIFGAALERLGCAPEQLLHVGDDAVADIDGAARLGIATAWLENERGRPARPPELSLRDLRELPERLARG